MFIYTLETTYFQWISWNQIEEAKEELRSSWGLCKSWDETGSRDLAWLCTSAGKEVAMEMEARRSLRWWCYRRYPASCSFFLATLFCITTPWIPAWDPQWRSSEEFCLVKGMRRTCETYPHSCGCGGEQFLWPSGWGSNNSQGLSVCYQRSSRCK